MTALHLAAFNGRAKVVNLLLDWGLDINAENKYSETPLHLACADGRAQIVKILLDWSEKQSALVPPATPPTRRTPPHTPY